MGLCDERIRCVSAEAVAHQEQAPPIRDPGVDGFLHCWKDPVYGLSTVEVAEQMHVGSHGERGHCASSRSPS